MLIPIDLQLLDRVGQEAKDSPRRRAIHRFHEHEDPVQRMINVVEPDSYVMPHKHEDPDKVEAFIILRGRAAIFSFEENGEVQHCYVIEEGGPRLGVEVQPRTWHCVVALEPGTALYEVLEGPYQATNHKTFASWAPPAEDVKAGLEWINSLKERYHL